MAGGPVPQRPQITRERPELGDMLHAIAVLAGAPDTSHHRVLVHVEAAHRSIKTSIAPPVVDSEGRPKGLHGVENLTHVLVATIKGAWKPRTQSDLQAHSTNETPGSSSGDPTTIFIPNGWPPPEAEAMRV
jgi:hypothetical protein